MKKRALILSICLMINGCTFGGGFAAGNGGAGVGVATGIQF